MMTRNEKRKWAQSLQVGDQVEDCRFETHTITKITHDFSGMKFAWVLRKIPDWIPFFVWEFICHILPTGEYVDSTIQLDDGGFCSAMSCCDPVGTFEEAEKARKNDKQAIHN